MFSYNDAKRVIDWIYGFDRNLFQCSGLNQALNKRNQRAGTKCQWIRSKVNGTGQSAFTTTATNEGK